MTTPPLNPTLAIVNANRTPTDYFTGLWNAMLGDLLTIPLMNTETEVSAVLDRLATSPGSVLYRGLTQWGPVDPGTNGEVLTLVSGVPTWAPTGAASVSLADLTDVSLSALSNQQVLAYSSGSAKWINSALATVAFSGAYSDLSGKPSIPTNSSFNLSGLGDVTITAVATNDVVKWNGSKWVNGTGGGGSTTLAGLTDVQLTSPTDKQSLKYVGGASKWENVSQNIVDCFDFFGPVGSSRDGSVVYYDNGTGKFKMNAGGGLASLTDVNVTEGSGINGYYLKWDNGTSKWIASAPPSGTLAGLTDVLLSGTTNGQVLTYNSGASKWENATPSSGVTTLQALSDVNVTEGPALDGKYLKWDNGTSKWIGGTPSGGGATVPTQSSMGLSTWHNQGSAVMTDGRDGVTYYCPSDGSSFNIRYQVANVSGSPFSYAVQYRVLQHDSNNPLMAFGFTDGTKHCIALVNGKLNQGLIYHCNNDTSPTSQVGNVHFEVPANGWIKVQDDGTNINFYTGADSTNMVLVYSEARLSYLSSISKVILGGDQYNTALAFCITDFVIGT